MQMLNKFQPNDAENIGTYYGYIPSPKDERNYKITRLASIPTIFPDEFCLDMSKVEVQDQGDIGCCLAEVLAYSKFIMENNESGLNKNFSVGFIYGNRSATDHQGDGMIPLEALKHLKNEGAVLHEDFPKLMEVPDIINEVNKVKGQLLPKAQKYRISAYAELHTVEDIKTALIQLKSPVLIGIPVYLDFVFTDEDGIVHNPSQEEIDSGFILGYHALTVVGWTKDNRWIVLNSWGDKWGDKGYCYMRFDYPIVEAWSMTDNIEPKNENKEEYEVDTLILLNSLADIGAGYLIMRNRKNAPVIVKGLETKELVDKAKVVIEVGGSQKYEKSILLSGANTELTCLEVMKYLGLV